jgi:integrase
MVALFTGIRPQEVLRLSWDNVKLDRNFVEVPAAKAKTRQRRIVELSENAGAWLKVGGPLPPVNQKE